LNHSANTACLSSFRLHPSSLLLNLFSFAYVLIEELLPDYKEYVSS
jgi:hypothetical protein